MNLRFSWRELYHSCRAVGVRLPRRTALVRPMPRHRLRNHRLHRRHGNGGTLTAAIPIRQIPTLQIIGFLFYKSSDSCFTNPRQTLRLSPFALFALSPDDSLKRATKPTGGCEANLSVASHRPAVDRSVLKTLATGVGCWVAVFTQSRRVRRGRCLALQIRRASLSD